MNFLRKKYGIKICEVWYKVNNGEQDTKSSIYDYYCLNEKIPVYRGYRELVSKEFFTLETDLKESEEEIFNKIEKNTKYEIKRADREGANAIFNFSKDILENLNIINHFDEEYVKMYETKGMEIASVKDRIKKLAENESILITEGKVENCVCAYHVYILSDKTARLTYSVSNFRENMKTNEATNIDKNMVGRINRWLHYKDMIVLKYNGFEIYDWGGYDIEGKLEGINKFKKGFGGTLVKQYMGKTTNSLVLWIIYRLLRGNK